jgi:hypothetical protein
MRLIRTAGAALFIGCFALSGVSAQQSFGVAGMGSAGDSTQGATLGAMQGATGAEAAGCPVALRAQHLADGSVVRARNGHPAGVGQWIHLSLANPAAQRVTGAAVTVRGMNGRGQLRGAQTAGSMVSDTTKDLIVQFTATSENETGADLWVPGMTAVERIDVKSLTYADGEKWQVSGGEACQVRPDPFMLVAGR